MVGIGRSYPGLRRSLCPLNASACERSRARVCVFMKDNNSPVVLNPELFFISFPNRSLKWPMVTQHGALEYSSVVAFLGGRSSYLKKKNILMKTHEEDLIHPAPHWLLISRPVGSCFSGRCWYDAATFLQRGEVLSPDRSSGTGPSVHHPPGMFAFLPRVLQQVPVGQTFPFRPRGGAATTEATRVPLGGGGVTCTRATKDLLSAATRRLC